MGRSLVKWSKPLEGVSGTGNPAASRLQIIEVDMFLGMDRRVSRRGPALRAGVGLLVAGAVAASVAASAGPAGDPRANVAWTHLETLVGLGPRPPGSPGEAEAIAYLRSRLEAVGARPLEITPPPSGDLADAAPPPRLLLAELPGGDRADPIVLFARFDSETLTGFPFVGANDGASGAAVLLELASRLAGAPLPYATWVAFLSGDRDPAPGEDDDDALPASRLLVRELERRGLLSRVRLAVYWNQVCDRDLQVRRDRLSDRRARDTFFREARRLGFGAQFPAAEPFAAVRGGHRAFWDAEMRRVVAIVDDRFGGTEAPGAYWHSEEDTLLTCAAESLDAVVQVSEAGLRANAARLARLDARTRRAAPPASVAEPAPALSATQEWEAGP